MYEEYYDLNIFVININTHIRRKNLTKINTKFKMIKILFFSKNHFLLSLVGYKLYCKLNIENIYSETIK